MANQNTKIYIEHSNLPEKFFSSFEDPRRTNKGHFYYPLNKILFLVISAVVSGYTDWASIQTNCNGCWMLFSTRTAR